MSFAPRNGALLSFREFLLTKSPLHSLPMYNKLLLGEMQMRFAVLLLGLFYALSAPAQEFSGRYQGYAIDQKSDGTKGEQTQLFMIFRKEGSKIVCSGGTYSFDQQVPCEAVFLEGSSIRFEMPFGGGVVFNLRISADLMAGTLSSKPGVASVPFNHVELHKIGGLRTSDEFPPLEWESGDRSPLILELRKKISQGEPNVVANFWERVQKSRYPIIEMLNSQQSVLTTFLWKGEPETKDVFLLWPRLSFAHPDEYFFSHIPGSDVWFKTLKVRPETRIYYQISPDDPLGQRPEGRWPRKAQGDPLNPKRDDPDMSVPIERVRSVLELPGTPPQPWYKKNSGAPRYALFEEEIPSQHLKSRRRIKVYVPPEFSAKHDPYPSIYLTDGEDPNGLVFATWTFENLVAGHKIPPMIVIRIVNPDQETRNRELMCDSSFTDYLNDEVVPFVRRKFNATADPSKTAVGGYSLGGLAAACAAMRHSDTFGLVLSQSGAYWFEPTHLDFAEPNWLARQFAGRKKLPVRFYMDAGTNELDIRGDGSGILVPNRQLRDVLRAKGYEVRYQEFAGDHDYVNWRGTLADGLIYLLGNASELSPLSSESR
jgi:enterochelin esterase-like enzyme